MTPCYADEEGVTRVQLDALDLKPGDYVTVHLGEWPEGVTLRGSLVRQHDALVLGHLTIVRFDGDPCELLQTPGSTLTTATEELRERLRADGRLWKLAYAEGEAHGRAEAAARVRAVLNGALMVPQAEVRRALVAEVTA